MTHNNAGVDPITCETRAEPEDIEEMCDRWQETRHG